MVNDFYPKNKLCKHVKGSCAGLDGGNMTDFICACQYCVCVCILKYKNMFQNTWIT